MMDLRMIKENYMYSNSIINFIYGLFNDGIKIWLKNEKIELFVPTGASLSEEKKTYIQNNRNQIIECLKENNIFSKQIDCPILRSNEDANLMSFAQERFWFLEKYEQGTNAYNVPLVFELSKNICLKSLIKSISSIVSRHEVLRTLICEDESGNGFQSIQPITSKTLKFKEQEIYSVEDLDQKLEQEIKYIFDLGKEIPIRVSFFKLIENPRRSEDFRLFLCVVCHHIAFDGWSIDLFLNELKEHYSYFLTSTSGANGDSLALPSLEVQYKDYALWQRTYLKEKCFNKQLAYWTNKLINYEGLNLITDRIRPEKIQYAGANLFFQIDEETSQKLRSLAKELKVSMYSLLLSAYCLMLKVYSNQNDIVLGTPASNRHHGQVRSLVGAFVNTLVLRIQLKPSVTLASFIKNVGKQVIEIQENQDLPFEKLVEAIGAPKDRSRHPIFQVMFAVQTFGDGLYNRENDSVTQENVLKPYNRGVNLYDIAKFDLSTVLDDSHSSIKGSFNYATSLYDECTVKAMLDTYKCILAIFSQHLGSGESVLIADIIASANSQHPLIKEMNNTDTEYMDDALIHELFEAQVMKTPHNIAVKSEKGITTYKELNEKANRLALLIKDAGVAVGDVVAVYQTRSIETITTLFAILKAGAIYVPIDNKSPLDRISTILTSIPKLSCLIATKNFSNHVQQLRWEIPSISSVIYIDELGEVVTPEPIIQEETQKFWDYISESSTDSVTAGGFFSIYNGEPFSEAEVNQYVKHVANLFENELDSTKSVLEIGCGSGLIMESIINKVKHYTGVDPSEKTLEKNKVKLANLGIENAAYIKAFAHEFEKFSNNYDIIILSSTVQFFPGYNYLSNVIKLALKHLKPNGKLIIADILDFRQKENLRNSLIEFGSKQKVGELPGLYVDESFFTFESPGVSTQVVHARDSFQNELRFRYDVILAKENISSEFKEINLNHKHSLSTFTAWHLDKFPPENLNVEISSSQLAYIIFTSGSTGVPKGVKIPHTAVINLIEWVNNTFSVNEKDNLLFVTAFTFDLSVYDVFGTLSAGASFYLVEEDNIKDPAYLGRIICEENITFWDSTPLLLNQVAEVMLLEKRRHNSLRLVFLSGDWIPLSLPDKLKSIFAGVQVISLGGATEATVWSNYFVTDKVNSSWQSIPYGKPIQNAKYYILDDALQPCPLGVPGQIAISGICVADGYISSKPNKSKAFVDNPIYPDNQKSMYSRLYLTGDMGRYMSDGNLEILGRIDNQVKIRGYRVELGEIESALMKFTGIHECSVLAKTNSQVQTDKYLIAFYRSEEKFENQKLYQFLQTKLPDYMLPRHYVWLEKFPLTSNGKLDREKLLEYQAETLGDKQAYVPPSGECEKVIEEVWKALLNTEKVGVNDNFFDIGGNSILLMNMLAAFPEYIKDKVQVMDIFKYPTIRELSKYIGENKPDTSRIKVIKTEKQNLSTLRNNDIAIIGMDGRFPGADNIQEFWENLKSGADVSTHFTREELEEEGIASELLDNPDYVKVQNRLSDIKGFDAKFFGYTPNEAKIIDPQQRIFLECCWGALEDAACNPDLFKGKIGVYAGVGQSRYYLYHVLPSLDENDAINNFQAMFHNGPDFISSRVAYKLNLRGPAVTILTGCSTSLVAVHQACEALLAEDCDIALAGGISLGILQKQGYLYQEGMFMSQDGKCKAFDASAKGAVFGQGVGVVALKPLSRALEDKNHIYAIIKGSALNNDGREKIGFTAPSVHGQADVIQSALKKANLTADSISYVETHGTGTLLGDPIEIEGLIEAFHETTKEYQYCAIGSVKTNIGHLDAAAGVTSLIKAALCLHYKTLVPSLHYTCPNPRINFSNSPFYVNTELKPWSFDKGPLRAGVSSFGIGGTNAHVILEEPMEQEEISSVAGTPQLISLSAQCEESLQRQINNLSKFLKSENSISIDRVAYTLNRGRKHFSCRSSFLASSKEEAISQLNTSLKLVRPAHAPEIMFLFSGEVPRAPGLHKFLYERSKAYKHSIDWSISYLRSSLKTDLNLQDFFGESNINNNKKSCQLTAFIFEYSLAQYILDLGIKPAIIHGLGVGEYVAACLAGVFTAEEALKLIATHKMLQEESTQLEIESTAYDSQKKSLFASNATTGRVAVAGQRIESPSFTEKNVNNFYSNFSPSLLQEVKDTIENIKFNEPTIPLIFESINEDKIKEKFYEEQYWIKRFQLPLNSSAGFSKLHISECIKSNLIINFSITEIVNTLVSSANNNLNFVSLRVIQESKNEVGSFLGAIGQLYILGVDVDWDTFYAKQKCQSLPLPHYSFERKEYWLPARKHG